MSEDSQFFVDPWLTQKGKKPGLPAGAVFICAYDVDCGIDSVREEAFLSRASGRDELWLVSRGLSGIGCAVTRRRQGENMDAALGLLDMLFRARVGFGWPSCFLDAGLVSRDQYAALVAQMKSDLDATAKKTAQHETGIVRIARELHLNPRPTGDRPGYWRATCPTTNHSLYINAATDEFFCGYCNNKGGLDDLQNIVEDRRKPE